MKKSKKKEQKTTVESNAASRVVEEQKTVSHPIRTILIKAIILSTVIVACLAFSDSKGYFRPDNVNNHTLRKWNSYYDFTKDNEVDVLMIGNSHLYTGINPKNLSTALGCNAFILASPGTQVDDHYFTLKEALKTSQPKLVIVETYGLKETKPKEKKGGLLSDQFKSFSARKKSLSKLASLPSLFAVKNYAYAWSNTLRNHNFLYTNFEQIEKNINDKNKPKGDENTLYLGRYIRFKSGIEDSTLAKYKTNGAPVDGRTYETNSIQKEYTHDIIQLCESNDIEIVFLTLPMYKDHVINYNDWKTKLQSTIGEKYASNEYWLDMQEENGYKGFTRSSFENTYNTNQHMTLEGSLLATYKLIDFIQDQERIVIPSRKNDAKWIDLFYDAEGFLQNNSPKVNDKKNKILHSNENEIVKEILLAKSDEYYTIIAKVYPSNDLDYQQTSTRKLRLTLTVDNQGVRQNSYLDLPFDRLHSTKRKLNFTARFKPLEVLQITGIQFIN